MDFIYSAGSDAYLLNGRVVGRTTPDAEMSLSEIEEVPMAAAKRALFEHGVNYLPSRPESAGIAMVIGDSNPLPHGHPLRLWLVFEMEMRDVSIELGVSTPHRLTERQVIEMGRQSLMPYGGRVVKAYVNSVASDENIWSIVADIPDSQSWTVGQWFQRLAAMGARLQYLDDEFPGGLLRLVRLFGPKVLIGQRESRWLDVKQTYHFGKGQDSSQAQNLALDICAFANSEDGGLYVIGCGETQETVDSIRPVANAESMVSSITTTIVRRILPGIIGLDVSTHPYDDGHIVTVLVPPQEVAIRPFIVNWQLSSDSWNTSRVARVNHFVAVPHRMDDKNTFTSAADIQAWLRKGYGVAFGRG
jgi:Putative DNA-binding domain